MTTEDQRLDWISAELNSLAFDVHRIIHAADPTEAEQILDYIERKVASARTAIRGLPQTAT